MPNSARAPNLGSPGARKRSLGNESQLVTAILKALKLKGVWCWRVNAGLTVFKAQAGHARRVVKGAEAGTPDILMVLPAVHEFVLDDGATIGVATARVGRLCGLEVKTTKGKQSTSQLTWQAKAEHYGVGYAVVRGVSDALAVVDGWRAGKAGVRD